MGFGGIETPDFAVGDDGPGGLAFVEERDDGGTGVFVGSGCIAALLVFAIEAATPGIGETEGERVASDVPVLVVAYRR